ncbi:hypothetical protein B6N60_03712 [Richelia sinica FACHB-800]|uniref:DUF4079 domain-containing protein n=1 Tax=Richelia sinica FACHB-800 TaxID=1357546 RepID=A0A975Y680_9NOST|nr:DUF4079 domain-containing protein [Richelia sinica]MBD2664094.1 DUF4079 domain-containing protein [Richelia sinica FACHB-800]QXE25002.1 hypothetical protein B6N60_03712 [Richelia sinica FACHB-800]
MAYRDIILLLHPVIAVIVVFPLIGIIVHRAWQTRQRRLEAKATGKSKISPAVGQEHVQFGRWLTGAVVGIVLLALGNDIFGHIVDEKIWSKNSFQVIFIVVLFLATIAAQALLYKAKDKRWRGIFATLTGMGLVILGCQEGIYRQTDKWYISHYYYGLTAALLMIFSLAILPDIYKDKTNVWRRVHIILNSIALLLFIAQGMSGSKALLEVSLSWQEPYIYKLYEYKCDTQMCTIESPQLSPQR